LPRFVDDKSEGIKRGDDYCKKYASVGEYFFEWHDLAPFNPLVICWFLG